MSGDPLTTTELIRWQEELEAEGREINFLELGDYESASSAEIPGSVLLGRRSVRREPTDGRRTQPHGGSSPETNGPGRRRRQRRSARSSKFLLTIYPTEPACKWLTLEFGPTAELQGKVRCWTGQWEKGEEGERLHIQLFIGTHGTFSAQAVKRWFAPEQPHVECARGSPQQCDEYCSKDRTRARQHELPPAWVERFGLQPGPWRFGRRADTGQGSRSDLRSAFEHVRSTVQRTGGLYREHHRAFAEQFPTVWIRYPGVAGRVAALYGSVAGMANAPGRTVIYIFGPTGSGKSTLCADLAQREERRGRTCYYKEGGQWWDNYNGDQVIIFEEFDDTWFTLSRLLTIIDPRPRPIQVQYKGGYVDLTSADTFIINSNIPPSQLYTRAAAYHRLALMRRITDRNGMVYFLDDNHQLSLFPA